MFASPEELANKLKCVQYVVADEMIPAIYVAMHLRRPVLVPASTGTSGAWDLRRG
jgi:hypothetical protein